jgi:sporulation protein YlmC with PRC-barrel domain
MPEREIDTTGPDAPIETVGDHDLIASDRVEGTNVYGLNGKKVGHVHNFMVNKRTGQVAHVIVSDSGLLGLGATRFLRMPWQNLTYDSDLGGYVSHISKEMMTERGSISAEDAEMQIW